MTETADAVTTGTERPDFPLDRRRCPLAVPQEYERMREENPLAPVTTG